MYGHIIRVIADLEVLPKYVITKRYHNVYMFEHPSQEPPLSTLMCGQVNSCCQSLYEHDLVSREKKLETEVNVIQHEKEGEAKT